MSNSVLYPEEFRRVRDANTAAQSAVMNLEFGGGGGDSGGMDYATEIALLKQRADQNDMRMQRVEDKLDRMLEAMNAARQDAAKQSAEIKQDVLAMSSSLRQDLTARTTAIQQDLGTKADRTTVWTALGTGAAISLAVLGIFVAVLAYLQDQRIATRSDTTPANIPAPAPATLAPPSR